MRYEIWHNPRCSKSRAALEILEESGVETRVRRYLDEPPTVAEIDAVLAALGLEAHQLARAKDADAPLPDPADRQAWLARLVAEPRLIERPVVVRDDGRAIVGRPPERVRELL